MFPLDRNLIVVLLFPFTFVCALSKLMLKEQLGGVKNVLLIPQAKTVIFDQELYDSFVYKRARPHFHTFEGDVSWECEQA